MAMSEEILKVPLSPAAGQPYGYFTEGQPIAEAIGHVVALQVDSKTGERLRRYGTVSGAADELLNIDNKKSSARQVVSTTIYFKDAPPLEIVWPNTASAVGEIAMSAEEMENNKDE